MVHSGGCGSSGDDSGTYIVVVVVIVIVMATLFISWSWVMVAGLFWGGGRGGG